MKIGHGHWKHYFGGLSMLLILLQMLTGLFLTLFYMPSLQEAYVSLKYLYTDLTSLAWFRDVHRWIALFFFVAIVIHSVRSFMRKEFLNQKKRVLWMTGVFLLLPMLFFLVTGLILPWDWKGYWFMEMVPNYVATIPVVGPSLKAFFLDAFTLPRNLIAHIFILPLISIILIDIHCFSKLRKKGVFRYLGKHALIAAPFLIALFVLAFNIQMPILDPEIIPMPLEGVNIPAPEWFFLILLLPFLYFKGAMAPFLGLYLPFILFLALAFLPYYLKGKKNGIDDLVSDAEDEDEDEDEGLKQGNQVGTKTKSFGRMAISFISVTLVVSGLLGGLTWGTYQSPTLGCNSCHNVYLGNRMGVPPKAFQDRSVVPLLEDNAWMVRHWFNPQIVW